MQPIVFFTETGTDRTHEFDIAIAKRKSSYAFEFTNAALGGERNGINDLRPARRGGKYSKKSVAQARPAATPQQDG